MGPEPIPLAMRAVLAATVAAACGGTATRAVAPSVDDGAVKRALNRSLPLLQASGEMWLRKQDCASCHHQALGSVAVSLAKDRGLVVDDALLERQRARLLRETEEEKETLLAGGGFITLIRSFRLVALGALGTRPDEATAAAAYFIGRRQARDGSWRPSWVRPPLEGGLVSTTALAVRALQLYSVRPDAEVRARIDRARAYLLATAPATTDDRAWQLFGLAWTGAGAARIRAARDALVAEQHADGGWGQVAGAASDAFATGQALVALQLGGGMPVTDGAYRRGVAHLLGTQQADGSWHIRTRRRMRGLPYFETGFPHGEDQFISCAASAYATLALVLTIHPERVTALMARPPRPTPPATQGSLLAVASFATASEAERRVAEGGDVDASDGEGTLLMRTVDDEAKVRFLLGRHANVNARSRAGRTALLSAAASDLPVAVLRLLVAAGADVNAIDGDGRSALDLASAYAADLDRVEFLLAAGAEPNPRRAVAPRALSEACRARDAQAARVLIDAGADVDGRDLDINDEGDGSMTPLGYVAAAGFPEIASLLLERGAAVDGRDAMGRTPLMWAAAADTDASGRILMMLLDGGADPNARALDGATALTLARHYGRPEAAALLEQRGARE